MTKEHISNMSAEHTEWLAALGFYKQELGIMKERLTEIAGKNTHKEVAAQLEHYENQIKVQNEHIDQLKHDIHDTLAKSAAQVQENNAGYIDGALMQQHERQKTSFGTTEQIINDLRQEFNRFAAEWM